MIKLYGFSMSNYHAMVKVFLLEKAFDFEEVYIEPSYSEPFLELSPMGKVPCIEVDEGYLSETTAILDFLESCLPEEPLVAADNFHRAQMAQLIKTVELYIGIESARVMGYVFFGRELNQAVADEVKPTMVKGAAALQRLASFSPYMLGDQACMADFFAYYVFLLARPVAKKVWGWELADDIAGLDGWMKLMAQRPMVKLVDDERKAAIKNMMAG
ncbi:MAG: glutathione S-transferase family protein [Porticoccaceae bacterium]|nr:glutathione S-transferase family protein [Porticoccaceae bacterium]MDG1311768.1 glutathione S-transferase family protein [Porticoccaceae bacterium]